MIKYLTIYVVTIVSLFILADYVSTWEIANNYPYGKLCEFYNNC
jgi:hypothetical protein